MQIPAGFQFSLTAPGTTPNTALDSTASMLCDLGPSTRPGLIPGTIPSIAPRIPVTASDINPGSTPGTTLCMTPSTASDTAPGSHSTANMDMGAAAPTSNNAPSTAKVPGQAATPQRKPMLQSQKRKAWMQPVSPGTQHGMTRQNSCTTERNPLHDHSVHDGSSSDPQQQVLHPKAVASAGVHQQTPADDTAAQSGSKKRRKKLLQQCALPFQAADGGGVPAPDKPPVPAKSRTKKPNKQPVSLVQCMLA